MTYDQIWEYVYQHFDVNQYWVAEDLIYDVEQMFNRTGSYFPPEARDLIRDRFQYRRVYSEMQKIEEERKQAAEMLGSGQVMQSLSDEIVEQLESPKSEIMDIDMTEYATQRETVIPPDIQRFAYKNPNFITRVVTRFVNFLRRNRG